MATGNIDCPISDRICNLQELNLNLFDNSNLSDSNDSPTCLQMASNINSASLRESDNIEEFANQLLSECTRQSSVDDNKNSEIRQSNKSSKDSSILHCYPLMDSNKNSLHQDDYVKHDSYAIFQAQNPMPEELFINVESDDEGVHSWRPNMSLNALCSDFFVTPSFVTPSLVVYDDLNLNIQTPLQSKANDLKETDSNSPEWSSEMPKSPIMLQSKLSHFKPSNQAVNGSRMDVSSLLRAQVAGLNNVKYETINARRRISEMTEEIQKLTQKLDEKLIVQRTLDVEKLREENAQLRLECQCLCMEVDYYLKGDAPLGEIDETFYQGNSQLQRNASTSSQDQAGTTAKSSHSDSSEDIDERMKWECNVCTFANHPAIKSCEMCQTPRRCKNTFLPSSDSTETCFCHPKRNLS